MQTVGSGSRETFAQRFGFRRAENLNEERGVVESIEHGRMVGTATAVLVVECAGLSWRRGTMKRPSISRTLGPKPLNRARCAVLMACGIISSGVLGQAMDDTLQDASCVARSVHHLYFNRVLVRGSLKFTKRRSKAYGSCFSYASRPSTWNYPLYPAQLSNGFKGVYTTDKEFTPGSDHLLNGVFGTRYKNGRSKHVFTFRYGFMTSSKFYLRNGDLWSWTDHDTGIDDCAFTYFQHDCLKEHGQEVTHDYMYTFIKGKYAGCMPGEYWEAKRKGLLGPAAVPAGSR